MSITVEITPEEQAAFSARAAQEGMSVAEWLRKLAKASAAPPLPTLRRDNLADLLLDSPFAGSELDLERILDLPY